MRRDGNAGYDVLGGVMADYTPAELIELFNERAAVREYDGGMRRKEAEQAAYWDVKKLVGEVKLPREIFEVIRKFKTNDWAE